MYLIILVVGLLIGAVFLIVLLIGDKRESRLEAQKKAFPEQFSAGNEVTGDTWPPPTSSAALYARSGSFRSTKPILECAKKILREFFRYRNAAVGVLFVSAIVYASYPEINFAWVLLSTISAALLLGVSQAQYKKRRRPQ